MQPQFEFVMTVHLRLGPHGIQKIGPLPTGGERHFVPLGEPPDGSSFQDRKRAPPGRVRV